MKYILGWDGRGDNGIDCSHLVCAAMIDAGGAREYFHRTAHDLHRLCQKITSEELFPWDLIFWQDQKERMEHVAIFLSRKDSKLDIIDASGPSSGLWSTTERTIDFQELLSFGRPPFFTSIIKTDSKRLSDIKKIYEAGASTFLERTSDSSIANNGGDVVEIREKFLSYIPEESLILDVGCGTGRDAKYFIEHGHRIVGIDICEPFIADLQRTTPGEFSIGDIVNPDSPVYEKKYDGIWANASLVHLNREEAKQVIWNCFHVLKKWGCFFVGSKFDATNTHMEEKESKSIPGSIKPYLYYTETDLKDDLEKTGFEILETSFGQWAYWWDQFIRIYCKK